MSSFDEWSGQLLPKRLPVKKAERWLAEHPEVNPMTFWDDQIEKHDRTVMRWTIIAVVLFAISIVLQGISLISRLFV